MAAEPGGRTTLEPHPSRRGQYVVRNAASGERLGTVARDPESGGWAAYDTTGNLVDVRDTLESARDALLPG
jgi:hypothetical protein